MAQQRQKWVIYVLEGAYLGKTKEGQSHIGNHGLPKLEITCTAICVLQWK